MAMISQDGAPSLKVTFQITRIPLDNATAEIGDHGQWGTGKRIHLS